jgi:hypothetical protein
MHDDIHKTVSALDRAVFGDRDDPKGTPGVIVEQSRLSVELCRTNEILTELRNAVLWINRLLVTGFITALSALVFKVL